MVEVRPLVSLSTGDQPEYAACHGENGSACNGIVPPLTHKTCESSHDDDMSFQMAAMNGGEARHWSFGNMLALEGAPRVDVANITAYIRAVQRTNGIN